MASWQHPEPQDAVDEPPIERWAREEALRQLARIATAMDQSRDFEREVAPLLRRLTAKQLAIVEGWLGVLDDRQSLDEAP
jgi:hypothetical protein